MVKICTYTVNKYKTTTTLGENYANNFLAQKRKKLAEKNIFLESGFFGVKWGVDGKKKEEEEKNRKKNIIYFFSPP